VRELYAVSPDGASPVKLSGTMVAGGGIAQAYAVQVAPDSAHVLYVADQETVGVLELYAVGLDGTNRVKLSGTMVGGGDVAVDGTRWPRFSPDGQHVVYIADEQVDNVWALHAVSPDGTNRRTLSALSGADSDVFSFELSSDGAHVIYLADQDRDGVNEAYAVALTGSAAPKKLGPDLPFGHSVHTAMPAPGGVLLIGDFLTRGVYELFWHPL